MTTNNPPAVVEEVPLACRAFALDRTQRARQTELLAEVRAAVQEVRDKEDGLAFRLTADSALFQKTAEWIALERRCCPFLDFAMEWRRDETVWVTISGPAGVKAFLRAEMGLEGR
jgi:hypothetical protein